MPYPYAGKYLRINLNNREVEEVILEPEFVKHYLLGSGIAAFLFKQELENGRVPEDPLDLSL